jgi:hypothetical protein
VQQDVIDYLPVYRRLSGWFAFTDLLVFDALLDAQAASGTTGDLLEIGVMHGKSAFFLSRKVRAAEELILCDLFEMPPPGAENAAENQASYPGVTRTAFETSAAQLATRAPRVLQMASALLGEHVGAGTIRFAHVDGGHLYPEVSSDVALSERLLVAQDGWVAFDDIRTPHAPGVAAAVWPALARGPLEPVLITPTKLYAAREPDLTTRGELQRSLIGYGLELEEQKVFDHVVLRVVEPLDTGPYRRPSSWRGAAVTRGLGREELAQKVRGVAARLIRPR